MYKLLSNVDIQHLTMTPAARAALQEASKLGMYITSAYRTAKHDREVGGTGHGYHVLGQALDVDGGYNKNTKFAEWAKNSGLFRSVLWQVPGHHDHVHVSWYATDREIERQRGGQTKDGGSPGLGIWGKIKAAWGKLTNKKTNEEIKGLGKDIGNSDWYKYFSGSGSVILMIVVIGLAMLKISGYKPKTHVIDLDNIMRKVRKKL